MRAMLACLLVMLAAAPALAQGQLRMVPVPADAAIVVPPRGGPQAHSPVASPFAAPSTPAPPELWQRLRAAPPPAPPPEALAGGLPLAPAVGLLLPLVAAALLGGAAGSGASAPAVTR
jgi:hypothetical protein